MGKYIRNVGEVYKECGWSVYKKKPVLFLQIVFSKSIIISKQKQVFF